MTSFRKNRRFPSQSIAYEDDSVTLEAFENVQKVTPCVYMVSSVVFFSEYLNPSALVTHDLRVGGGSFNRQRLRVKPRLTDTLRQTAEGW